ncbi:MAG: hypothetical protein RBT11_14070 [Desulfobacterales bacterium]|jgi:hypothetical protein|nr:hypothetical protein [Desulfobacterales bacterium]
MTHEHISFGSIDDPVSAEIEKLLKKANVKYLLIYRCPTTEGHEPVSGYICNDDIFTLGLLAPNIQSCMPDDLQNDLDRYREVLLQSIERGLAGQLLRDNNQLDEAVKSQLQALFVNKNSSF